MHHETAPSGRKNHSISEAPRCWQRRDKFVIASEPYLGAVHYVSAIINRPFIWQHVMLERRWLCLALPDPSRSLPTRETNDVGASSVAIIQHCSSLWHDLCRQGRGKARSISIEAVGCCISVSALQTSFRMPEGPRSSPNQIPSG